MRPGHPLGVSTRRETPLPIAPRSDPLQPYDQPVIAFRPRGWLAAWCGMVIMCAVAGCAGGGGSRVNPKVDVTWDSIVDLYRTAALGGSYHGSNGMGLMESLQPTRSPTAGSY